MNTLYIIKKIYKIQISEFHYNLKSLVHVYFCRFVHYIGKKMYIIKTISKKKIPLE